MSTFLALGASTVISREQPRTLIASVATAMPRDGGAACGASALDALRSSCPIRIIVRAVPRIILETRPTGPKSLSSGVGLLRMPLPCRRDPVTVIAPMPTSGASSSTTLSSSDQRPMSGRRPTRSTPAAAAHVRGVTAQRHIVRGRTACNHATDPIAWVVQSLTTSHHAGNATSEGLCSA